MYEVLRLYFGLLMEQKQVTIGSPFARSMAKALIDTLKQPSKAAKVAKARPLEKGRFLLDFWQPGYHSA